MKYTDDTSAPAKLNTYQAWKWPDKLPPPVRYPTEVYNPPKKKGTK